jgi:glycosyltransferase involved in cell wall biosynthesis
VLNQTFKDWQCVISDNASTDSTVQIAKQYESLDARFKVLIHDTNAGAAINWNRSKENNNSFATKLLCADDYMLEDALKIQLEILKKNQTSIVFSERYILFPSGKKIRPKLPKYSGKISFNDAFKYYLKIGRNIFGEPVSALFLTEALINSEGFHPEFSFSLDTSGYMAISRGKEVSFDDSVVGVFRVAKEQWSQNLKGKQFFDNFKFIDHLVSVEGIQVNRLQVLTSKLKAVAANLVRAILYKIMRDK